MKPLVRDIKITDLRPKLSPENKHLAKMLPDRLFPERIEFILDGMSNAVANAIRRTVACELPVFAMTTTYESITTDDVYIIPEMLIERIKQIPIDQSVKTNAQFELSVVNMTTNSMDIKVGEITSKHARVFNSGATLCTLQPGKSLKISPITITSSVGYLVGSGMFALAFNAISIAIDQMPLDVYARDPLIHGSKPNTDDDLPDLKAVLPYQTAVGISSNVANPRVWKIAFNTNGTMPAGKIVVAACNNLIERVTEFINRLQNMTFDGDHYTLTSDGESDTIGNLFMRTMCDMFLEIDAVVYDTDNFIRSMRLRVRANGNVHDMLTQTAIAIIETFIAIRSAFD